MLLSNNFGKEKIMKLYFNLPGLFISILRKYTYVTIWRCPIPPKRAKCYSLVTVLICVGLLVLYTNLYSCAKNCLDKVQDDLNIENNSLCKPVL